MEGAYVLYSGNGGAVRGAIAPDWADNSSWANVKAVYSAAPGHSGSEAQQIAASAIVSGNVQMAQDAALAAGNYYVARVWVKAAAGTHVFLALQNGAAPYDTPATTDVVTSGGWQQITAQGFVTRSESGLFIVGLHSAGTAQFDDASLTATPATPTPAPPFYPVAADFFGMHIADYVRQTITNPGFLEPYVSIVSQGLATRSGVMAHGWRDNSDWASVSVAYSEDTNGHNGGSAQQVQVVSVTSGNVELQSAATVAPQRIYTFSTWLRGTAGKTVTLAIANALPPYNFYAQKQVALSSTWSKAFASGLVQDSGQVQFLVIAETPQTFSVDDAALANSAGAPVTGGGVPWPSQPVGTLRLWDAHVTWADLEPQRGVWDFSALDAWVAAAAHGVPDIILTLGQSPTWASARPGESSYYGAGASAEPTSLTDWTDYVTTVAQRYKGKIRFFEIWNEPNDSQFFSGSVQAMVDLTKAASAALKAVGPSNIVVSPPAYVSGWVDQFLSAGGGAYVDVIGYHDYANPPENSAGDLSTVRRVLVSHGVVKELWDTEGSSGDATTPVALAPALLARKYLIDLAFGARHFDWYTWGPATDFTTATVNSDAVHSATPTGVAFGTIQSWLVGAKILGLTTDATGAWQMTLSLPNCAPAVIVWNPTANAVTTLAGGLKPTQSVNLAGVTSSATGPAVTATAAPTLYK